LREKKVHSHNGWINDLNSTEIPLRKLGLMAVVGMCVLFSTAALAQQVDVAVGANGLVAPGSSNPISVNYKQTIAGGLYPSLGGDFLFKNRFGVGAEFAIRASENLYRGFQPFRPTFYDVNLVWAPPVNKSTVGEIQGGLGAEHVRFYKDTLNCTIVIGCTTFGNQTKFMLHVGGGLRYYFHRNFFVRPEAHLYLIRSNDQFSSGYAGRYGVSLGYTFGSR